MNKIEFFRESIRNLKTVGTITRSSQFLCKGMIEPVDFKKADVIVELGAGDGVVTEHILNAMKPDAKLFAFEVNKPFCDLIREKFKNDKRIVVVEESAAIVGDVLKRYNIQQADYVISAIPFVSLPDELGYEIVTACKAIIKPKGLYIQIHYSLLMKKMYKKIFGNVDISFVPLNIPPAFVLVSEVND
ncbi:MAG: phospholipid N-methyltransferase [Polaribacter sp.]|jgi:phospholipid N-methyltransferase